MFIQALMASAHVCAARACVQKGKVEEEEEEERRETRLKNWSFRNEKKISAFKTAPLYEYNLYLDE